MLLYFAYILNYSVKLETYEQITMTPVKLNEKRNQLNRYLK